jgi:hypothetical protein
MPTPVTMALAGGLFALGLLIGYAWGKRKAIMDMIKKALNKAAMAKELKAAMSNQDDDKEDEEDEEKERENELNDMLNEFFSKQSAPGLDDHPQAVINPIMMLQIRKKKEEVRREMMYEKLLAAQNYDDGYLESLTPQQRSELAESLLQAEGGGRSMTGGVGSVEGKVRKWGATVNSTRILVDAGASFVPGANASDNQLNVEEKLSMDLRDKLKQIDTFLVKHHEVDVDKVAAATAKKRTKDGGRLKDALTVANETKHSPFTASHEFLTFDETRDFAQRGRARVAPPMDHKAPGGGDGGVQRGGRRSSVGNAFALDAAMKEAKEASLQEKAAFDSLKADGFEPGSLPPSPPGTPPESPV